MDDSAPFRVFISGQETAEDVLGLWQVAKLSASTDDEIGSLWRAELPDDPLVAKQALSAHALYLRQAQQGWRAVPERLQADLDALVKPVESNYSSESTLRGNGLNGPRAILETAAQLRWPETSFNVLDWFTVDKLQLEDVGHTISQFAAQVQRTVGQLALVETACGDRTVGISRVSWSGDAETWWEPGFDIDRYAQHTQVLSQALATRQGWLHFLLLVTSGAARVAGALATGPFSLLAIWTIWNYVKQVAAEYRQLRVQYPTISNS